MSLPMEAAYLLGRHAKEEGFVQFLIDCRNDGFVIESPLDDVLPEDERREVITSRVRALCNAWGIYQERLAALANGRRADDA